MDKIVVEFKQESKDLIEQLHEILDEIEGEFSKRHRLDEFGQVVDRILERAKGLELEFDDPTQVKKIGKYAELCKLVGFKASQIEDNEQFYDIVVALLMDATEMLEEITNSLATEDEKSVKQSLSKTFLERLQWVSKQFDQNTAVSDETESVETEDGQDQVEALLKAMGV